MSIDWLNRAFCEKNQSFKEKTEAALLLYNRAEWILQFTREELAQGQQVEKLVGEAVVSCGGKSNIQDIMNIAHDFATNLRYENVARDCKYESGERHLFLPGSTFSTEK